MNALSLSSQVVRNDDVAYTYIDDEMVIIGSDDQFFYGVNAVGVSIWAFLEGGIQSVQAICEHLQSLYSVTEEQCVADATQFIAQMQTHNMLLVKE